MSLFSRRSLLCSAFFVGLLPTSLLAADKPKEIRLDWATYNPVSMVLKEQGLLEKEFAKDGIGDPLGADARLEQGAGIPERRLDRLRLDRGLGGAGLEDQRQSDQVDLRLFAPRMDRAGDAQGFDRSPRSRT